MFCFICGGIILIGVIESFYLYKVYPMIIVAMR